MTDMRARQQTIRALICAAALLCSAAMAAQTQRSTRWHLPLDEEAFRVTRASDGVLVPSVQPMSTWIRPDSLKPETQGFEGLLVLGEVRQMVGDIRAAGTGIGLGGGGTFGLRGAYHVAASRWRMPLGFPLAVKWPTTGRWTDWDAVLLNESVASIDRLKGPYPGHARLWPFGSVKVPSLGARSEVCFLDRTWPRHWAHGCGSTPAWCNTPKPFCEPVMCWRTPCKRGGSPRNGPKFRWAAAGAVPCLAP